jgi:hypothetical protein
MNDRYGQADVEQGTMQLIIDQLEELIVTIVEEVRQRPGVAVAILAAIGGAVIGSMLASRASRRRASPTARVVHKARGVTEAAELAGLGIKLLQNPIVRSYVRAAVESQLKRRFAV